MNKPSGNIFATSVGVGIATGLYGISFGALAVSAGLDVWQTMVLSLLMFSGGSQFAFIGLLASAPISSTVIAAAVTSAWLLGIRNGFYAISLAPILQKVGLKRLAAAMLTIDESAAVATAQTSPEDQRRGFWYTGFAVYVFWNICTLLGAVIGNALGDPAQWGLDAAAAAAFLGLVWPRFTSKQNRLVALFAIATAVLTTPFLPTGVPVLLAAAVGVAFGWFDIGGGAKK